MPDPALLTTSGWAYLNALPAFMREDPEAIAIAHVKGKEFDRKQAFLDRVQANLIPSTADSLTFAMWEELFGIQPGTESDSERSATLASRWMASPLPGSGASWVIAVSQLLGAGWDYREHVPGVSVLPPQLTIFVRVPYAPGSDEFRRAQDFLEAHSPANIVINLQSLEGFALDVSQLDLQTL